MGDGPKEKVTSVMHLRGYDLYRAGVHPKKIRGEIGVDMPTWKWMLEKGSAKCPAYETMLMEEVVAIRTEGREAGAAISRYGLDSLRLRSENAVSANALVRGIIGHIGHTVREAQEHVEDGEEPPSLESLMPGKKVLQTLKELRGYCDMAPVALAFREIYGGAAAHKVLFPAEDLPATGGGEGEPRNPMQAAGDTKKGQKFIDAEVLEGVMGDLENMDAEDIASYAKGGEEPPPAAKSPKE